MVFGSASTTAFLAAQRAFIAAASRARCSGEKFCFLFACLACIAFTASLASSFRFSLANFFGPSRKRFSSRRIFFLKFLSFVIFSPACERMRVNDQLLLMSRHSSPRSISRGKPPVLDPQSETTQIFCERRGCEVRELFLATFRSPSLRLISEAPVDCFAWDSNLRFPTTTRGAYTS
jgi:hypothetical protein